MYSILHYLNKFLKRKFLFPLICYYISQKGSEIFIPILFVNYSFLSLHSLLPLIVITKYWSNRENIVFTPVPSALYSTNIDYAIINPATTYPMNDVPATIPIYGNCAIA